ncbi:methyltransferase type 11, putative [Acanthamoeba castellanii str. Neff]|uniref:Methyltransferase type 11, putative n=1 Tax=Acanthamoeba castellanii (strain ATCC 30010 / Neff) TaxID=1257118 RepID=L8H7P9_ACACF|nr:methyltransferase type 11, putative [Acanthamoeba castellanii str. Neff]ELR21150.1 methyltransferase type 11, putative [Acanthamoeba castellanii str. Neff]
MLYLMWLLVLALSHCRQELQCIHASDKDYKVLATDFAEAMVATCRTAVHNQGLSDIVECKQMDGQVIGILSFFHHMMFTNLISLLFQDMSLLRDDSVDAIGCVFGVMFFPNEVKRFREMLRVLCPGGCAVIVVWKKVAMLWLMQEIAKWLCATLPQASATEATDKAQSKATAHMVYRLGDPDELTKQLNTAGFTNNQIVSMSPFEAEWTSIEPTNEVVGMMLDKPGVKASYPPEQWD